MLKRHAPHLLVLFAFSNKSNVSAVQLFLHVIEKALQPRACFLHLRDAVVVQIIKASFGFNKAFPKRLFLIECGFEMIESKNTRVTGEVSLTSLLTPKKYQKEQPQKKKQQA